MDIKIREYRTEDAPGGVCPFGINDDIEVYLDESLKKFDTVYPAAGNDHSAVKLTIPELEQVADANGWEASGRCDLPRWWL